MYGFKWPGMVFPEVTRYSEKMTNEERPSPLYDTSVTDNISLSLMYSVKEIKNLA